MTQPLNHVLYHQLEREFGTVRITSDGESFDYNYTRNYLGEEVMNVIQYGECYNVCCPICRDTRYRLQINHYFGKRDKTGRFNFPLMVHCFNENCFRDREQGEALEHRLTAIAGVLEKAKIRPGVVVAQKTIVTPPGHIQPLHELPPNHPANAYLGCRFIDPEWLSRYYGVGYCQDSHFWLAAGRIYVPIYRRKELRGWQMRYVGDLPKEKGGPPKWWSCPHMKRRNLLYNFDQARKFRTGVIVEGPGDTWSFGPMATCTFGASMSSYQQREFVTAFRDGSGVLLYDPDLLEREVTKAAYHRLVADLAGKFKDGFAPVALPKFSDPGGLDRCFLRAYVTREAKAMGVKVSWEQK